jgi:hypothetical protein
MTHRIEHDTGSAYRSLALPAHPSFSEGPIGAGRIASMPDLTEDQRKVLGALIIQDATPAERTAEALREQTGLTHVLPVLRKLEEDFDPPLAAYDLDEAQGTRLWWATPAAGDLLDEA